MFPVEAAVHAAFELDWHRLGLTPRYLEPGPDRPFGVFGLRSLTDRRMLSFAVIECESLVGPGGFRALIERVESSLHRAIFELEKGGSGAPASCDMAKTPTRSAV